MRRFVSIAVLALASLAGARGRAAEAQAKAVDDSDRELAGHVFTPSRYVLAPFTTTAFGMTTLFGIGTAEGNRYDANLNVVGTRDNDVGAYGQGFDYSLRLMPALSLRVSVLGSFFTGTDGRSFLTAGTTAQVSGGLGATLAQNFGRTFRAGITLDASIQPSYDFVIANTIVEALDTGEVDTGTLLEKGSRARVLPGVSVAWAPHPAVGFVGQGAFVWSRRTSGAGSLQQNGSTFGASGDLDLGRLTPVALALVAFYRWEGAGGLQRLQDVGGGFFYSGRPALQLGLEVTRRTQTIRPQVQRLPLTAEIASLVLRYYW